MDAYPGFVCHLVYIFESHAPFFCHSMIQLHLLAIYLYCAPEKSLIIDCIQKEHLGPLSGHL